VGFGAQNRTSFEGYWVLLFSGVTVFVTYFYFGEVRERSVMDFVGDDRRSNATAWRGRGGALTYAKCLSEEKVPFFVTPKAVSCRSYIQIAFAFFFL